MSLEKRQYGMSRIKVVVPSLPLLLLHRKFRLVLRFGSVKDQVIGKESIHDHLYADGTSTKDD